MAFASGPVGVGSLPCTPNLLMKVPQYSGVAFQKARRTQWQGMARKDPFPQELPCTHASLDLAHGIFS